MKKISITNEIILFSAAIILALLIRFIGLGSSQLTDPEAKVALQAYCTTECRLRDDIYQPLYINLTTDLFQVFAANNFWARFVSALAGTALCATPFLIRKKIGSGSAILFSFILAVEPSLVAISRQAGSPILSILFFFINSDIFGCKPSNLERNIFGSCIIKRSSLLVGCLELCVCIIARLDGPLDQTGNDFSTEAQYRKSPNEDRISSGKIRAFIIR